MKTLITTVRAELVEAHVGSPSYRSTTSASFRARSWNPLIDFILRALMVIGLLMAFSSESMGATTYQLYVPDVCYNETMTKNGLSVNGQTVEVGDVLDVNLWITNKGAQAAKGVKIEKFYEQPTIVSYNDNSMSIRPIGATAYVSKTDSIGDDTAEYVDGSASTVFRLGSGADGSNGGTVSTNDETDTKYSMKVLKYAPSVNENTYYVSYSSDTLASPITGVPISKCTAFTNTISIKNPDVFPECGYFPDAVSTRASCGGSAGGAIAFDWGSMVSNNPDYDLATCTVTQNQWDTAYSCSGQDCKALPGYAKTATATYNNSPSVLAISNTPTLATTNYSVSGSPTITDTEYNNVTFGWYPDSRGSSLTMTGDILRVNTITMSPSPTTLHLNSTGSIAIGALTGGSSATTGYTVDTPNSPDTITIYSLGFGDGAKVNLTAKSSVYIQTLNIGRSGSDVVLKAKKVRLNTLTASNSGSGTSTFTIYADEVDIGDLTLGQGATVKIYPYTPGGDVFYKGNTINGSSSSSIYLSSGQYFVTSLSLPGTSTPAAKMSAMDANQVVNFFINGDFLPGNNPAINADDKNGAFGSLPSTTMRLFINGNLKTGAGGTTINALVYVEGNVELGSPTYIRGAVSAQSSISIGVSSKIYYDNNISNEIYGSCGNTPSSADGVFDAWEVGGSVNDKHVGTKIVNKAFSLSLVSLDTSTPANLTPYSRDVKYRLVNQGLCPNSTAMGLTDWLDVNFSTLSTQLTAFKVTQASQAAKVQYEWSNDGTTTLHSCSTDPFAIRPNAFKVFSQNLYKRAGEDFNITIKAIDEGNGTIAGVNKDSVFGITGYNASLGDLSLVSAPLNEKITITTGAVPLAGVNGCLNAGVFAKAGANFADGSTTATLSFSETGILDINLSEIPGKEWALVDAVDTNPTARYITPSTQSYDESHVDEPVIYVFIPYTIQTAATVNATTAQRWLYVNDNTGSNLKSMGGILNYTITAKNKAGVITQNFDKECFSYVHDTCPTINGLKKNTTFDLYLDANITMDADRNRTMRFYTEDNALVPAGVWLLNPTLNYTLNTPRQIRQWIGSKEFQSGVGQVKVYFNFDRNETTAIKPLNVSISDINTSTSWMTSTPGATNNFIGMTPADNNLTFVYGRIIPRDVRIFGANTAFTANGWYEVFNAPSIIGTPLAASRNDAMWYINTLHNDTNSGDASVTYVNTTLQNPSVGAAANNGMENYLFTAGEPLGGYKAHINTDSWLWYGVNALSYSDPAAANFDCLTHPCFNINVVPTVGATGSAKSTNTGTKNSKSSTSGGGAWSSTTDYAPAIR